VSFISLRKPEPEPVDEDLDETAEEPEDEAAVEEVPGTWTAAILAGVCGPGAWLAARFGTGVAWGAHLVGLWACFFYRGWTAVTIVLVWLLAVLLFTPREHLERAAAAIEQLGERHRDTTPEDTAETGEEQPLIPIVTVLWQLIGNAPGVHLKTLTKHLQAAAPETPVDRAQVRVKLAALGIPVRGSVRDAAGKVNEGVHRDGLKAWEQALPQAATGTPSEARSGPVATALTCDVGDAATDVATPLSAVRRLLRRGAA
jgi:hypothetical protein